MKEEIQSVYIADTSTCTAEDLAATIPFDAREAECRRQVVLKEKQDALEKNRLNSIPQNRRTIHWLIQQEINKGKNTVSWYRPYKEVEQELRNAGYKVQIFDEVYATITW